MSMKNFRAADMPKGKSKAVEPETAKVEENPAVEEAPKKPSTRKAPAAKVEPESAPADTTVTTEPEEK